MNLTRAALKNPAAVIVIVVLVMVFGLMSVFKLPIQLTPDIEQPQINISTGWPSAAPSEMESVIIEPIENVVKNTQGVTKVTTNIQRGFGNITLTFDVGADMQKAMLDVINNLNQAPPIPLDAMDPIVSAGGGRGGPNTASLMIKTLPSNPAQDLGQYQKLIEDVVRPRFSRIPGMGQVNLQSHRPRELRITFDPLRTASLGLSLSDISSTISRANDVSAGVANVGRRQYTVRFSGQYDITNLTEMIIGYSGDRPIYLKDVATVENTLVDRFGFNMRNGQPSYYFTLKRQNDANTVALLDEINVAIKELNDGPMKEAGLVIELSFDASVHIRNALKLVQNNLGLGIVLALIILWLFLRGWKSIFIIAVTIPISLMVAFVALGIFDRSLNVISLAGLAFSVGLVLDAAIIVQENIVRLRGLGMDGKKAVMRGALQVTGALFASTATSVAIFLPILFMAGIEGQLFSDLALTLSIAVIASLVTAITILPIASQYWLKSQNDVDPFAHYWEKLTRLVMRLTNNQTKRISWISLLLGGSLLVITLLIPKTDFMPRAPIDGFFFSLNMPPGGNVDFIEKEMASLVKERLAPYLSGEKLPKIKSYNFYSFGSGATGGFIYSADPTRVEELMDVIRTDVLGGLPDTQAFLFRGSMINVSGGGNGRTVELNVQGPDIESLMSVAQVGIDAINEAMPGTTAFPNPGLSLSEPELKLVPNDQRITQAGLTRHDVANAIRAYTSGLFIGEYFDGNDRVNVILRGEQWHTPDELAALPIHSPLAGIQTIGELTSISRTAGPTSLRRVDGKRTISIQISPPATMSLEEALALINEKVIPKMNAQLPLAASIQLSGNANKMSAAINDMIKNFALALVILFLLMTALFKSPKDSLLVLLVMPLAVAGGVVGLNLLNLVTYQSLDLLTMIGFIILLGLVVNNAILIVDQTRQAEREGLSRSDAVAQAIRIRARPVYMSTLTSLFGMLPLMVMPGVGSEIYRGLATVIVGGMFISAIFTLVLFPSLLRLGEKTLNDKKNNDKSTQSTEKTNVEDLHVAAQAKPSLPAKIG
ncbi:efflux RND transporter permease subunit [Colwellia psychrerythraea]|uniref:Acriflavin resistance protein n=1 Tax=Colwellia psychrerythraea TaxID=28229 RepID=A0A099KPS2_COLPS|nr:efflux RND transporter permease subunit [Colwellia psychrerythraea]KGJ91927.1 acriflavin resistance protein [Colwellia psychrerythraea]